MLKMVSIIVPVHNAENYLYSCIDSILQQTYPNIQLILVDDGSNDKSGMICDSYASAHDNVLALHQNNRGVSAARNLALTHASGQYIAFCDSDDIMNEGMIAHLVHNMTAEIDMSCCSSLQFTDESTLCWSTKERNHVQYLNGDERYRAILVNNDCNGYLWNKLFRAEIIQEPTHMYFDTEISMQEDELFVLEYLRRCGNMVFSNIKLYGYRLNPYGIMHSKMSKVMLSSVVAREKIYEFVEQNSADEFLRETAWNQLIKTYALVYKKLFLSDFSDKKVWMNRIQSGFSNNKSRYSLNSQWTIKEKIYYGLLLCRT